MDKQQRVRDPLHNIIEFGASEFELAMWRVVQTGTFQRLRRVKQLGLSDFVYPGATHSRFAHSLGVFHTARQLMKIVQRFEIFEETKAHQAMAAALLHDVGHGPFSHAFEEVGKQLDLKLVNHESISEQLIRESEIADVLNSFDSGFADSVADLIRIDTGSIYSAVVSSQFDADRIDYMQRDRLMTGAQHGAIDFEWLMANLEVANVPYGPSCEESKIQTFVLGPKAICAAETYVLGLFHLYRTVYLHKTTRGAEKLLVELLVRIISLGRDNTWKYTGLPYQHPLLVFARNQSSLRYLMELDDFVLWGALSFLTAASDEVVRDLALRLQKRRLYKCIDVRELLQTQFGFNNNSVVDKACEIISNKISDWLDHKVCKTPHIITDRAERKPYHRYYETTGPVNQIQIRTSKDELVDLIKLSKVVSEIDPFELFRVYVSNEEARIFVNQTIDSVIIKMC
ncbi:MAG: hypothetical protein TECD_00764 [Hyphomicrobiaceae bacterium hypho_1]